MKAGWIWGMPKVKPANKEKVEVSSFNLWPPTIFLGHDTKKKTELMEHTHALMVWQGWLRLCFYKGPCLYLAASPAAWPPGRPGWRWPSGRQWSGLGLCRRGRRPSGLPLSPERGEGTQRVRPLRMDRLKNGSVTRGGVSGFSRSFYRLPSERWPRSQFTYQ